MQCKICQGECKEAFTLPSSKLTGHDIPDEPNDCIYWECIRCHFLFTDIHDDSNHGDLYDEQYWETQDPDWGGRVHQTLRLVMLGNMLLKKNPWELKILDFGCGMGEFVASARDGLQMEVWGTDIIKPKFGADYFIPDLQTSQFDMIVACEVIEHLPFPIETMVKIKAALKKGGVFAFQTAYYDPSVCGRDWWYIGPKNGHISLYGKKSFDEIFGKLGGVKRKIWNDYPGLQAWQF